MSASAAAAAAMDVDVNDKDFNVLRHDSAIVLPSVFGMLSASHLRDLLMRYLGAAEHGALSCTSRAFYVALREPRYLCAFAKRHDRVAGMAACARYEPLVAACYDTLISPADAVVTARLVLVEAITRRNYAALRTYWRAIGVFRPSNTGALLSAYLRGCNSPDCATDANSLDLFYQCMYEFHREVDEPTLRLDVSRTLVKNVLTTAHLNALSVCSHGWTFFRMLMERHDVSIAHYFLGNHSDTSMRRYFYNENDNDSSDSDELLDIHKVCSSPFACMVLASKCASVDRDEAVVASYFAYVDYLMALYRRRPIGSRERVPTISSSMYEQLYHALSSTGALRALAVRDGRFVFRHMYALASSDETEHVSIIDQRTGALFNSALFLYALRSEHLSTHYCLQGISMARYAVEELRILAHCSHHGNLKDRCSSCSSLADQMLLTLFQTLCRHQKALIQDAERRGEAPPADDAALHSSEHTLPLIRLLACGRQTVCTRGGYMRVISLLLEQDTTGALTVALLRALPARCRDVADSSLSKAQISAQEAGYPYLASSKSDSSTRPIWVKLLAHQCGRDYLLYDVQRSPLFNRLGLVNRNTLNCVSLRKTTLLSHACSLRGDPLPVVSRLIELGVNIFAGSNPLFELAKRATAAPVAALKALLAYADANYAAEGGAKALMTRTTDPTRSTPLHRAARLNLPHVAIALIDAGAPLDAKDKYNKTPADVHKRVGPLRDRLRGEPTAEQLIGTMRGNKRRSSAASSSTTVASSRKRRATAAASSSAIVVDDSEDSDADANDDSAAAAAVVDDDSDYQEND
jgi:hypothetical protein